MILIKNTFSKYRHIVFYGLLMGTLVFILKWLQWRFLIMDNSLEIYLGLIAVFFTFLGVWLARHLLSPKVETVIVEKEVYVNIDGDSQINESEIKKLNLSNREYEVLNLLVKGYSNAEIAENLFLSLSTIKTHVSNIFVKMEVKRRTQVIEKAKRLRILK